MEWVLNQPKKNNNRNKFNMKKILLSSLLIALVQQLSAQTNSIFPLGELSKTDNHTGAIWLNELVKADSTFTYNVAVASYDKGAKLDWHIHPAGQILFVTEGVGYYQEKGKAVQLIRKGEVIKCLPGVTHWHGATPNSTFAYWATTPAQKGKTVWLNRVSEAEYPKTSPEIDNSANEKETILALSKKKWDWMAEKNTAALQGLFDDKAQFVHMGGSWGKEQELNIIKSGGIHYKKADVHETTVNILDETAIVLSKITLLAVVGGNEVTNPFIVTEVYVNKNGAWMLGSLSFTKTLQ
jgi:quercetin dioxygenase-like cupin family protein